MSSSYDNIKFNHQIKEWILWQLPIKKN
jgi:hypothetical protein